LYRHINPSSLYRIYNRPSIAELQPKGQKKKAAQVAKVVAKAKAAKTKAKGK
jgi:hypothetical protein